MAVAKRTADPSARTASPSRAKAQGTTESSVGMTNHEKDKWLGFGMVAKTEPQIPRLRYAALGMTSQRRERLLAKPNGSWSLARAFSVLVGMGRAGLKVRSTRTSAIRIPKCSNYFGCNLPAAALSASTTAWSRLIRPAGIVVSPSSKRGSIATFSLPVMSQRMRRERLMTG